MDKIKKEKVPPGARVAFALVGFYLVLKYVVRPPLPFSVIFMYMCMALSGAIMYLTLFYNIKDAVIAP
ncbi:MAG: hypothetical protein EPO39_08805, partial [Candidatus Manganitrophaceae bacterium]